MRDSALAEGFDLLLVGRCAILKLDPGHQLLAILLVRNADHLHIADGGVSIEELLDLSGIDVLSSSNHHVLEPAGYLAVIVLVQRPQVSGMQPAFFVYALLRSHGIVIVFPHDHVASGTDLARLPTGNDLSRLRIHDLHLCMGHGLSDSRDPQVQGVIGG